jgi:murein DD-endopeptidase MepM/ murein hydrolase activator NlpD
VRILLALLACLHTCLLASPSFAVTLALQGDAVQGGLMFGKTDPGATVLLDGKALRTSADGDFAIGFSRDGKGPHELAIMGRDGNRETRTITVNPRNFDIQRIDGLPERQVTPNAEDLARIRGEAAEMKAARGAIGIEALFRSGFDWPADGPISGLYGSQRILNGEPRAPHYGLDIAGPAGTPVRAAAAGTILFAHPGMYFNGRTLVIDHGLGLQSIYLHLSEISVTPGTRVEKGQVVGKIGATGRVTGAHLHWGLQWNDVYVDPLLVVPARSKP